MKKQHSQDDVQFCSRTICFDVRDDTLYVGTQDFEVLELGQNPYPDSAPPATSVEFDAGISKQDALDALRLITEHLEKNGLPETTCKVTREDAALVTKIQRDTSELSADLEKLPPHLRDWFSSLLTHLGEPWMGKYLDKLAKDLGVPDAADEGNDHE
jgi:hypothetical protein